MTADDLTVLARGLAVDTKAYLAGELARIRGEFAALDSRIKALSDTVPAAGPKGDTGDRGATGEPGREGPSGAPGPPGLQGPPGQDGKSFVWADWESAIGLLITAAVTKALAAYPVPRDGVDGKDGKDGADGAPGRDGRDGLDAKALTPEAITPLVVAVVDAAVAALPPARDGRDGLPGPPGRDGEKGMDGKDGQPGRDGADGKDGVGFDDINLTFDESKGWQWTATSGDRVKTWPVPMFWYDRTWTAKAYKAGTVVTKTGSLWCAMVDTRSIPGESKDWVLIVRRGQDGKDAKNGND